MHVSEGTACWCGHSMGTRHRNSAPRASVVIMSAREIFGTVILAMVTPFHEDGSLDLDSAQRLATALVDGGCDGILVSGTTGESPTTHGPEKADLVRAVREAVGGRAKVMAGAGSNDTAHAVRMAQAAAEAGADSLLVVSPYYNRPSQDGVAAHIETIASSTDLPVMVYDIPGRTGVAIGPACSARIAKHPNIVAFKDATGDPIGGTRRGREVGMEVYSGDDGATLAFLAHGGVGIVSVCGHAIPEIYREIVDAVAASDLATALAAHNRAERVVEAIMGTGQGAVMAKLAAYLLGHIETPTLRLPLVPAPDEWRENLVTELRALGKLA